MPKLVLKFKKGDVVRFGLSNLSVPSHYLPAKLAGKVDRAYLAAQGIALVEKLNVIFPIPQEDGSGNRDVEIQGINASDVEYV